MLTIRKMEKSDKPQVLKMMRKFYDSDAVIHKSSNEILEKDIDDALSPLPFIEGYVFEAADKTLGGYSLVSSGYTTEYGGICVWVEDLYLEPAYRKKGFSEKFFCFIESTHKEAVRFKLEVEEENASAIAAYKKNGYNISPYFEMTKEME